MDLPLHLRVLWRFKFLVAGGMFLALALAFLAVVKVSPSGPKHFSFRQAQVWAADVTLLVTPQRFPWGGEVFPQAADPAKFGELATIYANLATSDSVKALVLRGGPVDFKSEPMLATAVLSSSENSSSPPLPLVTLEAQAASKPRVMTLVKRETKAFIDFLRIQQTENDIPKTKRVLVTPVKEDQVRLLKGRSKTLPMMIFMLVAIATVGLAFMLENLRPRVRAVEEDGAVLAAAGMRRTA